MTGQPSSAINGKKRRKVDFPFLVPALLCNMAFISGTVPAWLCLNGVAFAYLSVAIFLISLLAHVYILFQWHKYRSSSPLGYAIVQPALHMVMLVYSLAVGSTSLCSAEAVKRDRPFLEHTDVVPRESLLPGIISEG